MMAKASMDRPNPRIQRISIAGMLARSLGLHGLLVLLSVVVGGFIVGGIIEKAYVDGKKPKNEDDDDDPDSPPPRDDTDDHDNPYALK